MECRNKDESIKDLSEQVEDMRNQIADLQTSNADLSHQKSQVDEEIATLKARISTFEERNSILENENKNFRKERDLAKAEIQKLEIEMDTLKREHCCFEQAQTTLKTEKETLTQFCDNLQITINKQKEELEDLRRENETQCGKHQEEVSELKKEQVILLHKLTLKHNYKLQKLLKCLHDLKEELDVSKREHVALASENEGNLKEVQKNIGRLEEYYQVSMDEFHTALKNKDVHIAVLEKEIDKLKRKYDHAMKSHAEEVRDILFENQGDIEKIREENQKQLEECKEQMEKIRIESEKILEDNENVLREHEKVSKENEKVLEENKKVLEENENLLEGNEKLLKEKEKLSEENEKISMENKLLQQEIQRHLQHTEGLEKRLKEALRRNESLEASSKAEEESIKETYSKKIEEAQYEMLQAVAEVQSLLDAEKLHVHDLKTELNNKDLEIEDLKSSFLEEKRKIEEGARAELKQAQENHREAFLLSEMQTEEKIKEIEYLWAERLKRQETEASEILKECQAISEYTIIQSEVEKNQYKKLLEEKVKEVENLTKNGEAGVQKELANALIDLEVAQRKWEEEREKRQKLEEKAASEKHAYKVTINTALSTIEALKKRLWESDRDVEQLKAELENCELAKLEFEGKCNQLAEELEIVSMMNDDLEEQHELTMKALDGQVKGVQEILFDKIEVFKRKTFQEILELKMRLEEKEAKLQAVLEHLHEERKVNEEAQIVISASKIELERLESFTTDFKFKNGRLETSLNKLQVELEEARKNNREICDAREKLLKELEAAEEGKETLVAEVGEMRRRVEEMEGQVEEMRREKEERREKGERREEERGREESNSEDKSKVEDLLRKMSHLEEKYNSYYQYCEYYKRKASEYEREIEELGSINKKYIETCGKYDQLLHKYEEVVKGQSSRRDEELEATVRAQARVIEKLKKELAVTSSPKKLKQRKCDKENINSPNRSLLTDSPGPLRERNN